MINPYNLLEGVLEAIEKELKENINIDVIADKFDLSERHLQRLFKFAFNQTIGSYIRSRKLAASIDDLLNTNLKVLDIALEYCFEYEPSYIRSFQREYGITPGDLRKTGKILKITPPLQLFSSQKYSNGVMFGPEIVVVPQFHVVGKMHKLPFRDGVVLPQSLVKQFLLKEQQNIPNVKNPDVLVCISSEAERGADYSWFTTAVQVKTLEHTPEGFDGYTFPTSLCAKFHFIGSNFDELNMHTADEMFKAINDFMDSEDQQYFLERKRISTDKFDLSDKNKGYLQSETVNVLKLLDNWRLNGWFDDIENQSAIDYKKFFEGGDAYINLVRKKEGRLSEHWMGMFMPKETKVPQGYEAIDFPKMNIGVSCVYGKRDEIVNYETECLNKM